MKKANEKSTQLFKYGAISGLLFAAASIAAPTNKPIITPEPIPPGYDFPAPMATIQKIADQRDVKAAREHAWQLWLGMNQASSIPNDSATQQKYLPIWETWFADSEITRNITKPITMQDVLSGRTSPSRTVTKPHQLLNIKASQLVSFNKFNPAAGEFIIKPHYGPAGETYYNVKGGLKQLNASWPEGTTLAQRAIEPFPPRAIETKPVFLLVKQTGLTAIPFWQGPLNSTNTVEPTASTWKTCVLIDPTSSLTLRPATPAQIKQSTNTQEDSHCVDYLYAGLSQIYAYQLTTKAAATSFQNAQGGKAEQGDYAVLVAMHVNTKEITNWTWQTFFWSGGETPPNSYPGSMSNQPAELTTPWNNYAMCTAYWQENNDGTVKTCFNPYLETATSGIPDGLNSNCMSCHGVARTSPLHNNNSATPSYPQNYIREIAVGPLNFNSHYFMTGKDGNTRTDFSWALGNISQ